MFKTAALVAALCIGTLVVAQDGEKKKQKKGPDAEGVQATCPISGAPVKNDKFASFGGGKVFFCCDNCVTKFNTMKAKMNFQLVKTAQVKQVACPMSGTKLKKGTEVDVAGVKVGFCCGNCQGKAEKMVEKSKDEAILALFNGKMHYKAFKSVRQIQQMKKKEAAAGE